MEEKKRSDRRGRPSAAGSRTTAGSVRGGLSVKYP